MTFRSSLLLLLVSLSALLGVERAHACTDAGPPNDCNEGGAEWIVCASNADCPAPQVCDEHRNCSCSACRFGETCEGDTCRCATQTEPTPPEGCTTVRDSCGDWALDCPPEPSLPEAGTVDTGRDAGVDAGTASEGGCSAGGPGSAPGALLLVLGFLATRRRR